MTTDTVRKIVEEYGRILDEGYEPELDEFLRHVPETVRDETALAIEAYLERRNGPKAPAMPAGPVKLSRDEAMAMFERMAARA